MVVLNRIYTKTGDDGTTALGSGERRPKYDLRIAESLPETDAIAGLAAVCRDRHHHAHGLGDGALKETDHGRPQPYLHPNRR